MRVVIGRADKNLRVKEIVLTLQRSILDNEPYLSGKCLTFVGAVGIACVSAGLKAPSVTFLFRDEYDTNDGTTSERVSRTFSHCTVDEYGSRDDYDAVNLSNASDRWVERWDADAVDKWGLRSEFDYETVDPNCIADLLRALTKMAKDYHSDFDIKEALSLASAAGSMPCNTLRSDESLSPSM